MAKKLTYVEFSNPYEADGTPKDIAEIKAMKADLIITISQYMKKHDLTHAEAAKIMGVHRCRVSEALRGQVGKFTIDSLLLMLMKIGYHCTFKLKLEAA
jgi:predicted XRE-type DNA-binding protein